MRTLSVTMLQVLRNARDSKPLTEGLPRNRIPVDGIGVTIAALRGRGLLAGPHNTITPAGLTLLTRYEDEPA